MIAIGGNSHAIKRPIVLLFECRQNGGVVWGSELSCLIPEAFLKADVCSHLDMHGTDRNHRVLHKEKALPVLTGSPQQQSARLVKSGCRSLIF